MAWTRLLVGDAVAPGAIVAVDLDATRVPSLGADLLELVVWRDAQGNPCVMDARCPHQWSHLAADGAVDGCELVCTAHFWRFDRQGCGTKVNVKGRRDPKSDIAVFACRERDGWVEADLGGPDDGAPDPGR